MYTRTSVAVYLSRSFTLIKSASIVSAA